MKSFRKLSLDDKPSFDRIFKQLQPETSDLTFTNLYMWQHSYGLKVFYEPDLDFWFLWAKPPTWISFFLPPVGDWGNQAKVAEALRLIKDWSRAENSELLIRRAPKQLVEVLSQVDPMLEYLEDRKTFDYIYNPNDLIHLAGRRFHGRRNHLNQFLRKYQWEYSPLTPALVEDCLNLETDWFNIKQNSGRKLKEEEQAMAVVLHNFQNFHLHGGVIKVDGKIQALAVGEKLNKNTAVIHIEKANIEFDGIYIAINQQFTLHTWADCEFINREEDMGIEGLRKAKLSYNPVKMIEKFSVKRSKHH